VGFSQTPVGCIKSKNPVSMRHFLAFVLLVSGTFSYGQVPAQKIITVDPIQIANKVVGEQFRNFILRTPDQAIFSNANFSDKIAFVNFWFESCPPCISELQGFNKLFDTLQHNKNFIFVSFTFDPDSTINNLKAKYHIKYQVFHINQTECYRLNFNSGFPASFVVNKKGVITYAKLGGPLDEKKSMEEVMTEIYPKIMEQLFLQPSNRD
jgi:cytochrome oxidase Cu insertion factor (SCO1/SenC/PrrC family)